MSTHPHSHTEFINVFKLDFAVCTKSFNEIIIRNQDDHVVELDNIIIDETLFRNNFYQSDNFLINPNAYLDNTAAPFISFLNKSVLGFHFCLVDEIFKNIENDLGISRSMFSPCTNISLNKQLNSIKSLCDLQNGGSVLCSMNWSDIVNSVRCEYDNLDPMPTNPRVILSLSVIFTNPTTGIYSTIVKFNFDTTITIA